MPCTYGCDRVINPKMVCSGCGCDDQDECPICGEMDCVHCDHDCPDWEDYHLRRKENEEVRDAQRKAAAPK